MKSELDRAYNENIGRRIREEMKKKHMTDGNRLWMFLESRNRIFMRFFALPSS